MDARTLFISDFHLGSRYASAECLADFLGRIIMPPEKIYIVGDLIDCWQINRRWHWSEAATTCITILLRFALNGTRIFWVVGNHDAVVEKFAVAANPLLANHITIGRSFTHVTADHRRFLVVHGDQLDPVSKADWLFGLGDFAYQFLLVAECWANRFLRLFGCKPWVLTRAFSDPFKQFTHRTSDFEQKMMDHAQLAGYAGIICGHCHVPELRKTLDGFVYANTGDWVESRTALYEEADGQIRLYRYSDQPR